MLSNPIQVRSCSSAIAEHSAWLMQALSLGGQPAVCMVYLEAQYVNEELGNLVQNAVSSALGKAALDSILDESCRFYSGGK